MDTVIDRGKTVTLDSLPQFSIALDGFVQGPQIDEYNHRYSFDHHAGCYRYCTLSACMQAWTAIVAGIEDIDKYTVFANDVDADVCMAIWCLKNPDRCNEPLVKKIVDAVGLADMHGGAFNLNGMTKVVEWISGPETDSKRNQDYYKISNNGLYSIMEAVLHRIDLYVNGEASIEVAKQHKHGEFNIIRNENDWALIESDDPHAWSTIYQAGFKRVVLIRYQNDGSTAVSIAKKSDFVPGFPLFKIYEALNKIEPGWGGSSSIGGAPRNLDGSRSRLSIDTITNTIDSVLDIEKQKQKQKV